MRLKENLSTLIVIFIITLSSTLVNYILINKSILKIEEDICKIESDISILKEECNSIIKGNAHLDVNASL
jgi:hypothetical protein